MIGYEVFLALQVVLVSSFISKLIAYRILRLTNQFYFLNLSFI